MPELPEVETIVCSLIPQIQGETITAVTVLNDSSVEGSRKAFEEYVPGRAIKRIHRRGKLLLMDLGEASQEQTTTRQQATERSQEAHVAALATKLRHSDTYPTQLGIHLKMSGRLFVYDGAAQPEKHTRIIFDLTGGKKLFFDDMRKFGYCRPIAPADHTDWTFLRTLGPEPLEIAERDFILLFKNRRTRIKAALLDQKVIAGVGNIYADESLFRAHIRPDAVAHTISEEKLAALHKALQSVLRQSIKECGSSIKDYRDAHGDAGAFQNMFNVYGRKGCLCTSCHTPLVTTKVAGRTTVFCEQCQT